MHCEVTRSVDPVGRVCKCRALAPERCWCLFVLLLFVVLHVLTRFSVSC